MDSANKRSGVERKHRSLSIAEKVKLLKKKKMIAVCLYEVFVKCMALSLQQSMI